MLKDVAGRVKAGEDLVPGQMLGFDPWPHKVVVEAVPNPGEIVVAANRHYQRPPQVSVPVLQLGYDDRAGRFPWEDDYVAPAIQPRSGTVRHVPRVSLCTCASAMYRSVRAQR